MARRDSGKGPPLVKAVESCDQRSLRRVIPGMNQQPGNIKAAAFLAGPIGRWARIVIGAVLVVAGVLTGGVVGIIVALVGLVPVGLGMSNRCLISRAIGAPWKGQDAIDMVGS